MNFYWVCNPKSNRSTKSSVPMFNVNNTSGPLNSALANQYHIVASSSPTTVREHWTTEHPNGNSASCDLKQCNNTTPVSSRSSTPDNAYLHPRVSINPESPSLVSLLSSTSLLMHNNTMQSMQLNEDELNAAEKAMRLDQSIDTDDTLNVNTTT